MRIIQKVCNGKTNETDEKIVKVRKNEDNSDSNSDSKHLKFVGFPLKIDQVILINL